MNAPGTGADLGHASDAGAGDDPPGQTQLRQLADEQAALRRVATLVARGIDPAEIFLVVAEEIRRLLGAYSARIARFDPDGTSMVVMGGVGEVQGGSPVGTGVRLHSGMAAAEVWRTGRPAQLDEDLWRRVSHPASHAMRSGESGR
jgi:GAF domain-containing protein